MLLSKNKKKKIYPCKPQLYYIKVGYTVVFISRTYSPDDNVKNLYNRIRVVTGCKCRRLKKGEKEPSSTTPAPGPGPGPALMLA